MIMQQRYSIASLALDLKPPLYTTIKSMKISHLRNLLSTNGFIIGLSSSILLSNDVAITTISIIIVIIVSLESCSRILN